MLHNLTVIYTKWLFWKITASNNTTCPCLDSICHLSLPPLSSSLPLNFLSPFSSFSSISFLYCSLVHSLSYPYSKWLSCEPWNFCLSSYRLRSFSVSFSLSGWCDKLPSGLPVLLRPLSPNHRPRVVA